MPPAVNAIRAQGASASWSAQKKNVIRIFNLFLEVDEELSKRAEKTWEVLPEEVLCFPDVYERFAYYMLNVYEPDQKKGEEHLDGSTTRNYLAIAIHAASDKFKAVGTDASKRFFDCLDTNSTSEHAKWLRGVKANIERAHCERADAAGKKLDKSETPIYLPTMKMVNAALARAGTSEAATRRLGLQSAWHSGGRSSESACITWDTALQYDEEMQAVYVEIKQSKISKAKLIAFVAGADRHCDWFLALADYMIMHPPLIYNTDEPSWMIHELHGTSSPGTKLGDWLRALRPLDKGGAAGYAGKGFFVPSLHENVNAGGIRPGVSNMLSKYMPGELVAHMTGHDFRGVSALYEYVDADRALALVPALVAAGWPALPWGQHGDGPVPPSIDALRDAGEDVDVLERINGVHERCVIDSLFNLDDASPPMLLSGGALRRMVLIAFASMIMYHDARMAAGEMRPACLKLIEELGRISISNDKLSQWGAIIRAKFDADNVHLTMGRAATGDGGLVQIVKALGRSLSEMKSELGTLRRDLVAERRRSASGPSTPAHLHVQGSPAVGADDSPKELPPPPPASSGAGPSGAGAMGPLIPHVAGAAEPKPAVMALSNAVAGDFYANCLARGGGLAGLSKQDKSRVELVLDWFNAMATNDEKLALKPAKAGHAIPSEGERRRIAARLQKLVIARLSEGFVAAGEKVPRELGKGNLFATALENRVRELKGKGVEITPVANTFAAWRAAHEQIGPETVQEGPPSKRMKSTNPFVPTTAPSAAPPPAEI